MRPAVVQQVISRRRASRLLACAAVALCGTLTACSGGSRQAGTARAGGSNQAGVGHAGSRSSSGAPKAGVRVLITPSGGGVDGAPQRGITVRSMGGRLTTVVADDGSARVAGRLNAAHTVWHSRWALGVSQRYTVTAKAVGRSGARVTEHSSFRTFTPRATFSAKIIEGYRQTYGVGMPIILYFDQPVTHRRAVERALEIRTSKPVTGSWYWDTECGTAPVCLYFRPRRYWPPHTRVGFVGHLDGVEAAPGVYGHHTLTQQFTIGRSLIVVASAARHSMDVYRDGKRFAHWPISTGRPGDDTPNGRYLTIEKANPVEMKGPGYDISVPWSVRFTWSGDYLHDAFWSVGEQGFTNVSHGCVNMSPADAETFYNMAVPGDPVKITGSPVAGTWDNGWTMWFMPWHRWLHGSALHKAVRVSRHGSRFVAPRRA